MTTPPTRMVAMDIDGTVTDSNHAVRPAVRAAIVAALDRGLEVLLATGRVLRTTRPVVDAIDPRLGAILNNGAAAFERLDAPALWYSLVPAEVAREVVDCLTELGLPAYVFDAEDKVIAVPDIEALPPVFRGRFGDMLRGVGDVRSWIADDPLMVTTLAGDSRAAEALVKEQTRVLGERFAGRATVSPLWHPLYGSWILDFIAPDVSKWWALCRYAALRGIEPSAILAIGDGLNDVPMVSAAGLGVAMGQSCPELLAVADVVVADNDHDGVAEAIERYVLA